MSIAIDAQILIWAIKKQATENRKHMIECATYNLAQWRGFRWDIFIPAHSLAEFLVGYDDGQVRESLASLSRSFVIAPFDAKAAIIAAKLQRNWASLKGIGADHGISKQQIKTDISVIASAIAVGATTLYTEDKQMPSLAGGEIAVKTLSPLPPPAPRQPDLFSGDAGKENPLF